MAGHNKWSKIKHQKKAADKKKSKIFSKHARNIQAEAERCGGDMTDPGLQQAIEDAKRDNMPKDTIKRAIKRATEDNTGQLERITYEAYGPGGVAMVIESVTDNRNRAAAEVRHLLSEFNIELSSPGSATWAFERVDRTKWQATSTVEISDEEKERLEKVMGSLEDNDEIQKVFTNLQV